MRLEPCNFEVGDCNPSAFWVLACFKNPLQSTPSQCRPRLALAMVIEALGEFVGSRPAMYAEDGGCSVRSPRGKELVTLVIFTGNFCYGNCARGRRHRASFLWSAFSGGRPTTRAPPKDDLEFPLVLCCLPRSPSSRILWLGNSANLRGQREKRPSGRNGLRDKSCNAQLAF